MTLIFIIGFMMGGIVGFAVSALLNVASDQDNREENEENDNS